MQLTINLALNNEASSSKARSDMSESSLPLASSVTLTELHTVEQQVGAVVFKKAYGRTYTSINKVYKRTGSRKKNQDNESQQGKLRGILKHVSDKVTQAELLSLKKLKIVRFDFKNGGQTTKPHPKTPLTEQGLGRSQRLKKNVDGYKSVAHRRNNIAYLQAPTEAGVSKEATSMQAVKGNMLFSFPGLVKFPTLADLEKCKKPYPLIPPSVLQEMTMKQCSVPPEEVTLKLLDASLKKTREGSSSLAIVPVAKND